MVLARWNLLERPVLVGLRDRSYPGDSGGGEGGRVLRQQLGRKEIGLKVPGRGRQETGAGEQTA